MKQTIIKPYETGYVKYLTDSEFARIRQEVEKLESPSKRLCLELMMFLGLRIGEAVRLQRSNFNKDFSKLVYCMEKSHKMHERHIPKQVQLRLMEYNEKYQSRMKSGFIFFADYRNPSKNVHIRASTIRLYFRDLRRSLGLDEVYFTCKDGKRLHRVSPHTLRHYALWKYYQASGNDIIFAQQLIGHSKIETTSKYINALKSGADEGAIMDKAFGGKQLAEHQT